MTSVTGDWLANAATQTIFSLLLDGGYQAYVVGGCVRNALLDAPVADVDFTTDAHPKQVMKLAQRAGLGVVPTGIEHGTVTIVSEKTAFEVTTYRKDVETDGRRAIVAFAATLTEDAHRRDFTMNALYADRDGQVIDPLGGLADINARQVRFIDCPHDRIREDYLRILRFFRFHAWFGDPAAGIDPEALAACAELAEGLDGLSKERIGMEMGKLLSASDPAPSVASMDKTGILGRLLPGATAGALAVLVHLEGQIGAAPDWVRRLACLGGSAHATSLRMSRANSRKLTQYLNLTGSTEKVHELAYRHGAPAAIDISLLRAALLGGAVPENLMSDAQTAASQKFPIKAADITTGEVGPDLGARLKHLEDEWIASRFTKDRAALLA